MAKLIRRILDAPPRARSREAARFVWQLDDQSRRLLLDVRGASPEELEWQPAPGMNTIGMLLLHIALTEIAWVRIGLCGATEYHAHGVIRAPFDQSGVPLPPDGRLPAQLAGKNLGFFRRKLAVARAHTRRVVAPLRDRDLGARFRVPAFWSRETRFEGNARWMLYHVLEHEAGHYGQINLLRHLYAASRRGR